MPASVDLSGQEQEWAAAETTELPVMKTSPKSEAARKQAVSAANLILKRLEGLNDRISQLAVEDSQTTSLNISQSLDHQSQTLSQMADVLKNLQGSLVSAVTEAVTTCLVQQDRTHSSMPSDPIRATHT
ncbi:MAG: hypothetical protein R3C49_00065 [Planctomycetaceae bacterium]